MLTSCSYGECLNAKTKFQLTEFLGGTRTRTRAFCSSTHLLLSIMNDIQTETGHTLDRSWTVAMNMLKKFTDAVEKEWKSTAPKKTK